MTSSWISSCYMMQFWLEFSGEARYVQPEGEYHLVLLISLSRGNRKIELKERASMYTRFCINYTTIISSCKMRFYLIAVCGSQFVIILPHLSYSFDFIKMTVCLSIQTVVNAYNFPAWQAPNQYKLFWNLYYWFTLSG